MHKGVKKQQWSGHHNSSKCRSVPIPALSSTCPLPGQQTKDISRPTVFLTPPPSLPFPLLSFPSPPLPLLSLSPYYPLSLSPIYLLFSSLLSSLLLLGYRLMSYSHLWITYYGLFHHYTPAVSPCPFPIPFVPFDSVLCSPAYSTLPCLSIS